jgi:hypothetical protein
MLAPSSSSTGHMSPSGHERIFDAAPLILRHERSELLTSSQERLCTKTDVALMAAFAAFGVYTWLAHRCESRGKVTSASAEARHRDCEHRHSAGRTPTNRSNVAILPPPAAAAAHIDDEERERDALPATRAQRTTHLLDCAHVSEEQTLQPGCGEDLFAEVAALRKENETLREKLSTLHMAPPAYARALSDSTSNRSQASPPPTMSWGFASQATPDLRHNHNSPIHSTVTMERATTLLGRSFLPDSSHSSSGDLSGGITYGIDRTEARGGPGTQASREESLSRFSSRDLLRILDNRGF